MNWAYADNALIRIPVRCPANGYYMRWYYNGWHYWFFLPGLHVIDTEGERYRTLSKRLITVSSGQVTRGQAEGIRTIMNTREVYLWTDGGWAAIRIEPGSLKIYQSAVAGTEMELTAIIGSREVTRTTGFSPVPPIPNVDPTYPWCTLPIVISDQTWMCKNYDIAYPGSRVYNNDEANRAIYGGLYTYDQIMAPGFVPAGWHVPTVAEWTTLITACGGLAAAGGVLKEAGVLRWNAPNAGAVDTYDFAAVGGGYSDITAFNSLMNAGMFWTADALAQYVLMNHDSAGVVIDNISRNYFLSVRLLRDAVLTLFPVNYGYLYNWFAATDVRNITASGWSIPSENDFWTLTTFLDAAATGTVNTAGGPLKEIDFTYWNVPNTDADNTTAFNGRGAGFRNHSTGIFSELKVRGTFWNIFGVALVAQVSSLENNAGRLLTSEPGVSSTVQNKKAGYSIRPVKDTTTLTHGQVGAYTGNDGRVYRTICIGTQEWLADNLCETLYRDGSPIPEETGNAAWAALTTGARCSYSNNESNAHA